VPPPGEYNAVNMATIYTYEKRSWIWLEI